jgi:isopentenyldiphosphate isomerase
MSSEELFDVVNEHDEVIGQMARRDVHRMGLRHRAVHVLVFNSRGELFLQKRSQFKDCFPGCWDSSASGHLAPGESYDDCAVREVQEELGVRLCPSPRRLFKLAACEETGQEFVWVYRWDCDGPFELHPEEIESGGWFHPQAISAWIARAPSEFASGFRLIWQRM